MPTLPIDDGKALTMLDASARPVDSSATGRVLDAHASFGRRRAESSPCAGMVSRSPAMLDLATLVERLAPVSRGTLVEGEPGTGKSLLVSVVHRLGPCPELAPMRLGADDAASLARLQEASAGSLVPLLCVVPELADLSSTMQVALASALRTAEPMPLGAGVHAIAATAFETTALRSHGRLRDDLYYLLTAARYRMPGLNDRRADVPDLVTALLRDVCRGIGRDEMAIAAAAIDVLTERTWPGHVRELRNVLIRAVALSTTGVIGAQTIREACALDPGQPRAGRRHPDGPRAADDEVPQRATAILSANESEAAERLGMSRRSLCRLLERLDASTPSRLT